MTSQKSAACQLPLNSCAKHGVAIRFIVNVQGYFYFLMHANCFQFSAGTKYFPHECYIFLVTANLINGNAPRVNWFKKLN